MESQTPRPGASETAIDRRTFLRAGALSVPMLAVAIAAPSVIAPPPATAAGVNGIRDLSVEGDIDTFDVGVSSDSNRYFEQGRMSSGRLFTVGEDPTPSGSVLRVEWDPRCNDGGAELFIKDSPVQASGTGTAGSHGAYATFTIDEPVPVGIPQGETGLSWSISLGEANENFYPENEDLHPYTVLFTPPTGYEDPDMANNGWSSHVSYGGTGGVTDTNAPWRTVEV